MPWKWDVTICDRRQWAPFVAPYLLRTESGELVLRCKFGRENAYFDDFYAEHGDTVTVSSTDGGRSWEAISRDVAVWEGSTILSTGVTASDGSIVDVVPQREVADRSQEIELLKGLGRWHADSHLTSWTLWPESEKEALERQGLHTFHDPTYNLLFEGVVGTHTGELVARKSTDGGQTWGHRIVDGLPEFTSITGWFRGGIRLPDGVLMGTIYGRLPDEDESSVYALRSMDGGDTWTLIPMTPPDPRGFNETSLLQLPSGRIVAMMRTDGGFERPGHLWQCHSDDGGLTWSNSSETPIWGHPPHLLRLRDGNVLCTYAHRRQPVGIRACLSRDDCQTWDVAHEKILRDDGMQSGYGVGWTGYPMSAQLEDDTIFTAYVIGKTRVTTGGYKDFHCYLAGSRYTEDYTGPLGWEDINRPVDAG